MTSPSLAILNMPMSSFSGGGPRLIRLTRVMELTALPRSTIYEMVKIEMFPKPVKIGKRGVAWVEQEIIDWIKDRINSSRG